MYKGTLVWGSIIPNVDIIGLYVYYGSYPQKAVKGPTNSVTVTITELSWEQGTFPNLQKLLMG